HFDSASVQKGILGSQPRTMWVIDYAQLERIYYSLVAGYDVFGNLSHQTNIRRYMDFLRIEGELNFLEYMPKEDRIEMLKSWYIGD
ncbi:fatty acid cis/trans isomerase, partial [Pseudomonas sp. 5S1]